MSTIECRGLSAGSLFKLLFLGLFTLLFIFCVTLGIFSIFGFDTIVVNDQYVHGINGFLASIAIGIVLPLAMSIVLWAFIFVGIKLFTLIRPIKISLVE